MLITRLLRPVNSRWTEVRKRTTQGVQSMQDAVLRGGIIFTSAILVVWLSIFLYTAFYYAYMPSMSYIRPVHLQFKSCDKERGICSFPSAYVRLTNKQQILMVGQPYRVHLLLEMPESPANKELGMFMVCADLRSRNGLLVQHACRPAMLHYRSTLLHTLNTLIFSPMMIFGSTEEKQSVLLELFDSFEEDQNNPVTSVYVEIQSRHIEFYSATVLINAHLSGLRYLMFHWPLLSATVGIGVNLFLIALVCILSYLHFTSEEENGQNSFSYEEDKRIEGKPIEEKKIKAVVQKESSTWDSSSRSSSDEPYGITYLKDLEEEINPPRL